MSALRLTPNEQVKTSLVALLSILAATAGFAAGASLLKASVARLDELRLLDANASIERDMILKERDVANEKRMDRIQAEMTATRAMLDAINQNTLDIKQALIHPKP